MTGIGISYGAITVINAMPVGIGATIGVNLKTEARFAIEGISRMVYIKNDPSEDTKMAEICVRETYKLMRKEEPKGWTLTINSEIPVSRGLKSSSSACNAIISAVLIENKFTMNEVDMIKLGVNCAREAGVTVTGSFDDACGCQLGGLVITDNTKDKIIIQKDIEDWDVVIYVPNEKIKKHTVPIDKLKAIAPLIETALSLAETYPCKAMTMNGHIIAETSGVDNSVADMALQYGALGAGMSGSGPAIAIILNKGRTESFLERTKLTNVIKTTTRRSNK